MASTYLTRTFQSGGNRKKWTMSMWVKRNNLGADQKLFQTYVSTYTHCPFDSSDRFQFQDGNGGNKVTTMTFKDTSAWYHIVVAIDTDLSTAGDRYKIYVNGNRITAFDTDSNPSQGYEGEWNKAQQMNIGRHGAGSGYLDACLSHIHFCDGYQYQASDFGSTDSTTGEWKINTSPNVSYGTTGFFILKDGNSVTDQSGNSNNWTANGNLTNTEDNPSNVFATLSPHILPRNSGGSISNGNLTFGTSAAQWTTESSAFGITNGKYYFEVKLRDNGNDRRFRWGLQKNAEITKTGNNKVMGGADNNAIGYATAGESATQGTYFINQTATTLSDGDINENNAIYGYAIDLDNQRMYGHFNGTWLHSGNPSAGTGGIDVSSFYTVGEPLFPSFTVHTSDIDINFGNGYFGTTAVATNSGNGYQDADGNGIFNYTVPTNYRALCTKGLNQ